MIGLITIQDKVEGRIQLVYSTVLPGTGFENGPYEMEYSIPNFMP